MAAIVLAGGRSSRMGTDKALLPWDGRMLIEAVISRVAESVPDVLVVTDSRARYSLPQGIRTVCDLYPGDGPLGGIITGLAAAGDGVHPVVACDTPYVRPELLRLLIAKAVGFDAAAPVVDGWLKPLPAAYTSRSLEPLRRSFEAGNRAVHRALETLNVNRVPEAAVRVADPGLASFCNINTPEDYVRAKPPG